MSDEFMARIQGDFARLLIHWQTIEFWIKRAEQVNKKAVIPAINELRYASRQLFQAVRLFGKEDLTEGDKHVITKRITIAEQYLLNADHDICDAIVGFFAENVDYLDKTYGVSQISTFFVDYPKLRECVEASVNLISDSRREYDNRKQNYEKLRESHFSHLISSYKQMLDAEVSARFAAEILEYQLTIAQSKVKTLTIVGLVGTIASVVAIPLSIYLWMFGPQEFCKEHSRQLGFSWMCSVAAKLPGPAAINFSADEKPNAMERPPRPLDATRRSTRDSDPFAKPPRAK